MFIILGIIAEQEGILEGGSTVFLFDGLRIADILEDYKSAHQKNILVVCY